MSSIHQLFKTETHQKMLHFEESTLQQQPNKIAKLPPLDESINTQLQKMSISKPKVEDPLSKLLKKIKFHEQDFARVGAPENAEPSDAETRAWLQKMGLKNPSKTSVGQRVPRAAFNPRNGSLLVASQKAFAEVRVQGSDAVDVSSAMEEQLQKFRNRQAAETVPLE